jgi:hypothetical protein
MSISPKPPSRVLVQGGRNRPRPLRQWAASRDGNEHDRKTRWPNHLGQILCRAWFLGNGLAPLPRNQAETRGLSCFPRTAGWKKRAAAEFAQRHAASLPYECSLSLFLQSTFYLKNSFAGVRSRSRSPDRLSKSLGFVRPNTTGSLVRRPEHSAIPRDYTNAKIRVSKFRRSGRRNRKTEAEKSAGALREKEFP